MQKKILGITLIINLLFCANILAQNNTIDEVVAIVGSKKILKSDIENDFLRMQTENPSGRNNKHEVFEQLLLQKLLLNQAEIDSIEVTDAEVENNLERRLDYMISQIGSKHKLEAYFKKDLYQIKADLRKDVRNMMITERVKQDITKNIHITPAEVRAFYKKIPQDSLPSLPDEYEIQQIVLNPKVKEKEKERIRKKLKDFREKINAGGSFSTYATLYSDDRESAKFGGELGYTTRGRLVPEFANVAFNLKEGKISKIVETEYGFHIIQLIDRKGDKINCRHILLKPKVDEDEINKAKVRLDSISDQIRKGKIKFGDAAYYYSDDKNTKNNNGLVSNPANASSKLTKSLMNPQVASEVDKLKIGEISNAFVTMPDKQQINQQSNLNCKIIKLKTHIKSHKANLSDDWDKFQNQIESKKQQEKFQKWIIKKQKETYIHIAKNLRDIKFTYKGWIK